MNWQYNPYDILGLATTASIEDVKSAYRRLARRLHPDVNPNNPAAASQFRDVTDAHELLLDPVRRRSVDEWLTSNNTPDEFYFTLQVTPSKRAVLLLPETQVIYLLAEIFPDPKAQSQEQKREARINLTLVLDYSNSMSGPRIEKVKIAARQIIDSLNEEDILSVVIFNDRATTIIPATKVFDKPALKAKIGMINPVGGTEIFQGLKAGIEQTRTYLGPRLVNHLILLTDGHTFGDQEQCLQLADEASKEGISFTTMGLGSDWNDEFLDDLATRTGGSTLYVKSANSVVQHLNDQVRNLSNAFAERVNLSVASNPDVVLESAFKLSPHPQPLEAEGGNILLGSLQANRPVSVLLQFQLPGGLEEGFRYVARLAASGSILANKHQDYQMVCDFSTEVTNQPSSVNDDPPSAILDALSKLTLYRLQERAREALESGNIQEATRRLENLATRLIAMGETNLATQALTEAKRVAHTRDLSDEGRKELKYQTRFLLLGPASDAP